MFAKLSLKQLGNLTFGEPGGIAEAVINRSWSICEGLIINYIILEF